MSYMDRRGQIYEIAFNRSSAAMYRPTLMEPNPIPQQLRYPGMAGLGQLLPQNMQTVKYADGTTGFLDPSDGTYYDSQGNDVTGYVQNFGGATVTGTATAAQIAAAEGISPPSTGILQSITSALAPGPSPRVTVPAPGAAAAAPGLSIGVSTDTLLLGGLGLLAVMMLMGGGGGRRR
jgi:hypothetical protein